MESKRIICRRGKNKAEEIYFFFWGGGGLNITDCGAGENLNFPIKGPEMIVFGPI
jgi:hypothetical protein